ncbi:LuxR C-terminal-related transcriptional regulator [Spirosoma luteum]|uniref:LuxR C-terminal-related transcriptional regulator n=1 Tax=Spirosoma luteum TaxID=431553 RepID=UPI00035C183F|nr:LuxR C-terminal-related transcriptional regulator [Spirosoma luteum]
MNEKKVRQLAAVMFADLVGNTALMQRDEKLASTVRARHREVFQQQHKLHQGKIIQYYGDGVLSVFKSAVDAVHCAIDIQRRLQEDEPVALRIGLHLGDIVFDKSEVYGDGVNVASRIESLGVAGCILVSGKLNDELKNHTTISTTSLGHFALKNIADNIADAVEVFAITNEGIKVPEPTELKGTRSLPNKTSDVFPVTSMNRSGENKVLLTKLHISPPGIQTVHRTELFEKLATGLKTKLMLISAPAGFGKTTLVSDWIIQQKIPAAWYSIDTSDNDAAEFLSYMITAIQGLYPKFGENALKLLHSPSQISPESIIQVLINELISFPKHFLVVLDDFHIITNREVLTLFTYFIEFIPPTIHLVILTRADPNLPIAKLRSQHQLVELRATDLSFSANEIHFLFNRTLKLKLNQEDVQSLTIKTEGWIAGLQLIALALQGREDSSAFIQAFKGNNRYIMDYLIEEVLKIQTPETKEFLLQTSLLEQLSGPLCDAVLDRQDSQTVLEMLERNNVFIISLDAERKWFRYHHLFADLLKQRLLVRERSAVMKLHAKASVWFEQNQQIPLAIEHLFQIQDYGKAIELLEELVEGMWEKGHHTSIIKYGDLLPDELIKKNPRFSLFYAWVLITAGQIQKAAPFLASAEQLTRQNIANGAAIPDQKKLVGKLAVALAYQHSFMGKPEIILAYCRTALDNLSEEDPLWFSWGWYAVGRAQLANENLMESTVALKKALVFGKKSGNIYLITTIAIALAFNEGRLGRYNVSYQRSVDLLEFLKENGYAALVKTDWTFAVLFANMAAIKYFWADLDEATENIKIAYRLCIHEADMTSKVLVLVVYSVLLHGQGDLVEAELKIKEMEVILQKNKVNPFLESMYIGWKATWLVSQNELEKARAFLDMHDVETGKPISYLEEYRYIAFALLLMAEHKMEEAYGLLSQLYEMASAQGRIERMIETKVFLSIVFLAIGDKEKALSSLTESLSYAATDEILMYHLNYLERINPLLQEIFKKQATAESKLPQPFIDKLKYTIEKRKKSPSAHFKLTTRDREALQLLAGDLTNQEIADKLFISLNTVKSRLKDLYVKLEVDSRSKAVEKAKQLRLI